MFQTAVYYDLPFVSNIERQDKIWSIVYLVVGTDICIQAQMKLNQ